MTVINVKPHGCPPVLGDLDEKVCQYVRGLRKAGGIVNTPIVRAAARGIVMYHDKSRLAEFGGSLTLSKSWASSLLDRLGYTQRKGTRTARKTPPDFDNTREQFLKHVHDIVERYSIPPQLIINWDQTGLKIIPVDSWTMAETGTKQVDIIGLSDKREITALLAITAHGHLLPPQLLYQGKTDLCHPKFVFPDEWDIFHSENHWSNVDTMIRYVEKIIVPYVENCRDLLAEEESLVSYKQKALCLFDVFAAHRASELIDLLRQNNIEPIYIPASCTDKLQPLDLV